MLSDCIIGDTEEGDSVRLNPCSNGICSLTETIKAEKKFRKGLNPCSNGICSLTEKFSAFVEINGVLILVLMEYAL